MIGERYTVQPQAWCGWYVADEQERCLAAGPYATKAQAAYECDRLRQPAYHGGAPRPSWEALTCPAVRGTWECNPTPRTWAIAA